MRLCVPLPCFFGDSKKFPENIKLISSLGFDAVESYNWKEMELDAVRSACDESGVEFLSICTSEFNLTNPSYRKAWLEGLQESCLAAKRLGAKKLITQVGPDTGEERAKQHGAIVETLIQAKPILEEYGITVMLEPLNVIVDHPGYYLIHAKEGFDIVREVDNPFVKIVYDIYHQQISEGNIIPTVKENLKYIAHLHAAGHPGRHELQDGESNYRFIFDEIDKAGYTGACGLEYHPKLPPVESLVSAKILYGKRI